MYKLMKNSMGGEPCIVLRLADGANIPFDPANTDYQAYLQWLEESPDNKPIPADEQ